jgi:LmbE family N-acetylglucosaminyl deacetylase
VRLPRIGLAAALIATAGACTSAPRSATAQTRGAEHGAVALGEAIEGLGVTTRVLMIAAHPDDEDSRLIAWLSRGRHVETAYLSLTRGDGGQNLIGDELGEALGVIRTQELLAARRIDGAHQYFGREFDFGFSKTAAETFQHWPHDSVLGDVVTVVRAFRPHVIVAVFTGTPQDGHGHHQVSGIVAREAYDAAADTVRFPVSKYGPAWAPDKFYRDRSYFGGGDSALTIDVGGYDALLGETYPQIAALSRSQHKSQGMGQIARFGPASASLYREATRVNASTPRGAERSMFDGIDTTWARLRPLAVDSLLKLTAAVQRAPWASDPASVRPALAAMLAQLDTIDRGSLSDDARATVRVMRLRVTAALLGAAEFDTQANAQQDVVAVGEDTARVVLAAGRGPLVAADAWSDGRLTMADSSVIVADTAITQPWWLVKPRVGDLFGTPVSRVAEDQRPSSVLTVTARGAGVEPFATKLPVYHRVADPVKGEIDRPLAGVPGLSVTLDGTVAYVPAGQRIDRSVRVLLRNGRDIALDAKLSIELPRGLTADSATRSVALAAFGVRRVEFRISGTMMAGDGDLRVVGEVGGRRYARGYVPIDYDHIRPQKMYRDAVMQLRAIDIVVPRGLTVAYVPGVGDNVAPALASLGVPVTVLDTSVLATTDLSRYSTVVVGPRAYQASPDVSAAARKLLDFARGGGTLVVQYGQNEMTQDSYMPYPITMTRPADRVTDEGAAVTVLDPKAPVLAVPNRIGPHDWDGWVQERSLYMPHTADAHYKTVVAMHDPGESDNPNGILVTPLGKGMYVYTTLSFFRQLPAGNPGAARLFVNLLAARQ